MSFKDVLVEPNYNAAPPASPVSPAQPQPQLYRMDSFLDEWRRVSEELYQAKKNHQPRGPVTGLPQLDRLLGGGLLPGLHAVHGQPTIGKTSFGVQVASTCGTPAIYITCEMPPVELFRKVVARETSTYIDRFRTGSIEPAEATNLYLVAMHKASQLVIADGQRAPVTVEWLLMAAQAVKGKEEHLLVVVDSFHSWSEGAHHGYQEYERLNYGLTDLRRLSAEVNCSVLAIYERNRSSMDFGGMSAGAGSRKLEYAPDTVIELDKAEVRDQQDENGEIEVRIKVSKNRHGAPGQVRAIFNGGFQSFREIE